MPRKRHNVDHEVTEACHFLDPRSYVTQRGKLFRFGADKQMLRRMCFERDNSSCTSCAKRRPAEDLDMHHVVPLGRGGDDKLSNVTTRCKWSDCHKKEHVAPRWGAEKDVKLV
jgi:5-methylcytosine-specific restriction endonuclease McrA